MKLFASCGLEKRNYSPVRKMKIFTCRYDEKNEIIRQPLFREKKYSLVVRMRKLKLFASRSDEENEIIR
jgi:hypothetical protein